MQHHSTAAVILAMLTPLALALAACSSSPSNPVNQTPPIQAMDDFFRSLNDEPSPPSAAVPDYRREPGYAPAYPPYEP